MENNQNQDTSALSHPVPVVLCGKTTAVGEVVTNLIKPDLEVIHFMDSVSEAADNLPSLLAGQGPKSPSSNHVGTHNYSKAPRAVIFGRAFAEAQVKELIPLCRGMEGSSVAWIVGDPNAEAPTGPPGPGYAEKAADDVKKAFARWADAGAKDGESFYY